MFNLHSFYCFCCNTNEKLSPNKIVHSYKAFVEQCICFFFTLFTAYCHIPL